MPSTTTKDDETTGYDPALIRQRAMILFSILGATLIGLLAISASLTSWKSRLEVAILDVLVVGYTFLCLVGFVLWNKGDSFVDKDAEAKYVTTTSGRQIEYFVWGSTQDDDATVCVVCHGSNATGKLVNQYLYPDETMKELNVKIIAPSYPGHGGSDTQWFRRIKDWPKDDLDLILKQEKVDKFMIQGTSYGTAHAMATAVHYPPEQCIAMGLNVPYLPAPVCREFGFTTDADSILNETKLSQPWILFPVLALLHLFEDKVFDKAMDAYEEGKEAKKRNLPILSVLQKDCRRSFLRGVNGQCNEILNGDTNNHWQDPRSINTPHVAIWYADDDTLCPTAHGKWLADLFEKKKGIVTDIRHENVGLGHFTYLRPMEKKDGDKNKEGLMTKALLDLVKSTSLQSYSAAAFQGSL